MPTAEDYYVDFKFILNVCGVDTLALLSRDNN